MKKFSIIQKVAKQLHIGANNTFHRMVTLIFYLNDNNDDIQEIQTPPRPIGRNSPVGTGWSTISEETMVPMIQLNSTLDKHITQNRQNVRHLDLEDQEAAKMVKTSIQTKYNLQLK